MEFLNDTKVYGLAAIEDYLLIPLTDGNPLLLIAPPGTAKTLFIRNLTRLLGYEPTQIAQYSAPTMNYEDIVGYPVPIENRDEGQTGFKLEFANTPVTVWDKRILFIDEVNRCKFDVQNLLLQLIQDRMCAGVGLNIDYIFAAQNELSERGTVPLDNALADRFSMLIPFPKFSELSSADQMKVARNVGYQDSPLLKRADPVTRSERLIQFLGKVREKYHSSEFGTDGFAVEVCRGLNAGKDFHIDGRRVNRIATNIKIGLIIRKLKTGGEFSLQDIEYLSRIIYYSMPALATEIKGVDFTKIKTVVAASIERIVDQTRPTAKYFLMDDPIQMVIEARADSEINQNKTLMNEIYQHSLGVAEKETGEEKKVAASAKEIALALHALTDQGLYDKNSIGKAVEIFGSAIYVQLGRGIRTMTEDHRVNKFINTMTEFLEKSGEISAKDLAKNKMLAVNPNKVYNQGFSNHVVALALKKNIDPQQVFVILKQFRGDE
jgi:hypothetical protein